MESSPQFAPIVVALSDARSADVMYGSLADAGYPVVCAHDGEHALVALDETRKAKRLVRRRAPRSRVVSC